MLTLLAKLLKLLNSEQSPSQMACAVSLAAIVGMTPLLSLHNFIIFFLVFIFRVNLTVFILCWPLFSILGLLVSPLAEIIGSNILQAGALVSLWEGFYNTLFGRWSNFYYTGVMGGLVVAIVCAIILYPISKVMIVKYREKWLKKFEQFYVVKMLKASKFWQLYNSFQR